ncbi:hypothetical protein ACH41H_40540 [Streptomyces sp. NPDC020800]|uniref:hypothetical protein n=1 Tax=Streptomyces sp. NPDC020800 TaxID=3365092 RepID=UPI0037A9859F
MEYRADVYTPPSAPQIPQGHPWGTPPIVPPPPKKNRAGLVLGSAVTVDCEVLRRTWSDGKHLTYPVCAWADGNTWARVAQMTLNASQNADLKVAAGTTLRIRSAMVKAAG